MPMVRLTPARPHRCVRCHRGAHAPSGEPLLRLTARRQPQRPRRSADGGPPALGRGS